MSHNEFDPIIDILEEILGDYSNHNDYKCQISFDCPVCSYEIKALEKTDGKGNLEVNYKYNVYKCWSCGETHDTHGSIYKLIKKFGTPKQLKKYVLLRPDDIPETLKPEYRPVKLPAEYHLFYTATAGLKMTPHYKRAMNYLKKRNVTDEMIKKFNIGFCYDGFYANRIIIPSYDDDFKLNYFVARSYETKPKLKYRNPEAQKEIIIFNEYLIDWSQPIHIVEGPFDSIFLPNSIPMLGKVMSEKLFAILYEKAVKIIIVLDGDAYDNAEQLYYKLNGGRLFGKIWLTKLPIDQDIADLQGNLNDYPIKQLD
jgi:hypothetical protein